MDPDEKEAENALKTLLPDLINHLDPCLITSFLAQNLITEAERETIEAKETDSLKIGHLLTILRRKRDNKKVMWTIISLLEGELGEYKKTHEKILNTIATAFPPYSYVCNSRKQPQHIQNPDTLPESESNVMQSHSGIPAVPMNTDSSLDFGTTRSCQTNLNYTGQMIFERIGNREWLAKFIVVKDVSILTQYLTNNQSKYEEGERIPFHFRDPIDGYVELDLIPSQDMCSKGWTLKSDKAPLRILPFMIHCNQESLLDFWYSEESTFEALDLEISEKQLQTLFDNLLSSGKTTQNIHQLHAILGMKGEDDMKISDELIMVMKQPVKKTPLNVKRVSTSEDDCRTSIGVISSTESESGDEINSEIHKNAHIQVAGDSGVHDNTYCFGMRFERIGTNKWLLRFMVMNSEVFLPYIQDYYPDVVQNEVFTFSFQDPVNGFIEFCLKNMYLPQHGWNVKPHKTPSIIMKRDVDLFSSNRLPIPPSCLFTVWADVSCNPDIHFFYDVRLYGMCWSPHSIRIVHISRFLYTVERTTTTESSLPLDTDTDPFSDVCYCELGIDDLNEIFRKCKAFSNDWKFIGLELGVKKTTLDIIDKEYFDVKEMMLEMLASWLKREVKNQPVPS